jgi:acyl carrier protein
LAARLEPGRPLRACGLDSLEFVDLLCAIEAEFRVRLNNEDLKPETTVDDLVALIATRAA